ncbi:uncharacterized protein LOC122500856 isoform X1 [Leptopilina heterotoma]|uniref:uncharacterized protein LOC122500856 isoform X1 n=1 Tax=Leptopilina heterotoma TaxID=63436 RepID=UPI001CA8D44E|nr:uncharacterized protein LOC122500856 isoform X1 [Leptopilina heterotoma]
MESSFILYLIISFNCFILSVCRDDRVLYPNFQISLSQFRKNCKRKNLLPAIVNIQQEYANVLNEISEDLLLKIYYKETNSNIINNAIEHFCNNNTNLNYLLYNAADKMLGCLDNSENVDAQSLKQMMLSKICNDQAIRLFYNMGFYYNSMRSCFWEVAKNISQCFIEQCDHRLWRIAENCECVGANCSLCNEICYDPFYNNILLYAPINFSQKECDDLHRRVNCQLDVVKHCATSVVKLSYELIYSLERVPHCRSKVPDWH